MTRKSAKQIALGCLGFLAVGILLFVWLGWYYLPMGPFFDDGPFHGVPVAPVTDRAPSQSFGIFNGFTLEVFDSSQGGVSAVVQLRDETGVVRWAIQADGYQSGDVASVRFDRSRRGFTRSGTVEGSAQWTYGQEYSVWFITGDGALRDYWYSW